MWAAMTSEVTKRNIRFTECSLWIDLSGCIRKATAVSARSIWQIIFRPSRTRAPRRLRRSNARGYWTDAKRSNRRWFRPSLAKPDQHSGTARQQPAGGHAPRHPSKVMNARCLFIRSARPRSVQRIGPVEKLAILKAWEADERALLRAEDEGMGGGEHAHLHKVQAAHDHLRSVIKRVSA